jgi:uncharacterized protein (TIGR00255 family)
MAIESMTGFARASGADAAVSWTWELRSVNGRGLEVRLRLPPGYEGLEAAVRDATAKALTRGSLNISLNVQRQAADIRINEAVLDKVLKAVDHVHQLTGCERPRAEGLLALKGVLEVVEDGEDEAAIETRRTAMLASLGAALADLVAARGEEGRRLAGIVGEQLDRIVALVAEVEASPARSVEAVQKRLKEQLARVLDNSTGFDPQRLAQEAALIATRADVEEELKRLRAHVEAAHDLLADKAAVGRRLDFLMQEFNREANTLCSKANDIDISRAGLALKAVIDQMREQLQNIE